MSASSVVLAKIARAHVHDTHAIFVRKKQAEQKVQPNAFLTITRSKQSKN
jgi:hypothetical protein